MSRGDIWADCISEAFESAKIVATKEQINEVVAWVESTHDNWSTCGGYSDGMPDRDNSETENLKIELKKEREKIQCHACDGKGRIITHGPCHSSNSQCYKCQGEGRVSHD